MASKSDSNTGQRGKRRSPRKTTSPVAPTAPAPVAQASGAKRLLRAGLKALNEVRDDVLTRQSRVFEALLGIDTSKTAIESKLLDGGTADVAGMHKFEEIFDQRVARSLERLGMPSPQALAALCRQLEAINQHLKRIEPAAPERPPRRRSTRT